MLHAHIYAQKHKMTHECYLDAMDYDDNFDLSNSSWQKSRGEVKIETTHSTSTDRESY